VGGSPAPAPAAAGSNVSTWDFVRMILVLACVIGAIYALFWLLRRGAGRRVQENDLIKVLGSKGLNGSRSLHLVEVGGSVFLVGASDGGVQLIAEITDKESLDSVRLKAAEEAPTRRTFQQALAEIFRPARRPFTIGDGLGFLKGQHERLKKL
jgi:flagellar protein FliO/FliZ